MSALERVGVTPHTPHPPVATLLQACAIWKIKVGSLPEKLTTAKLNFVHVLLSIYNHDYTCVFPAAGEP